MMIFYDSHHKITNKNYVLRIPNGVNVTWLVRFSSRRAKLSER